MKVNFYKEGLQPGYDIIIDTDGGYSHIATSELAKLDVVRVLVPKKALKDKHRAMTYCGMLKVLLRYGTSAVAFHGFKPDLRGLPE